MGRVEGNISGRTSEARLHLVPVGESIESPTTQEPVSRREIRFFGKEVQIATPTFEAPSSPEKATRTEVEGIVFLVPVLNDGKGLEKFIGSIQRQKGKKISTAPRIIIVGDNGSDGVTQYRMIEKIHEFKKNRDDLVEQIEANGTPEERLILEYLKERRRNVVRDLKSGKSPMELLKRLEPAKQQQAEEVNRSALNLYNADTKHLKFLLDILNPKSEVDEEIFSKLTEKTKQEALATMEVYAKIALGFYDSELDDIDNKSLVVRLGTPSRKGFLGSARESLLVDGLDYLDVHHPNSKECPSNYILIDADADMQESPDFVQTVIEEFNNNPQHHALVGPIVGYSEKEGQWKGIFDLFSKAVLRPVWIPIFFRQPMITIHKHLKDFMRYPRTLSQGGNTMHDRYAAEKIRQIYGHLYPVPGKTAEDAGQTLLMASRFPFIHSRRVITPFPFRQAEIQLQPHKSFPQWFQNIERRLYSFMSFMNGRTNWGEGLRMTLWKVGFRDMGEHASYRLQQEFADPEKRAAAEPGFTTYRGVDAYTTREIEKSWGIPLEPYEWVERHAGATAARLASLLPGRKIVEYFNPVRGKNGETRYAIIRELPPEKRAELPEGNFVVGYLGPIARLRFPHTSEEYMRPKVIKYMEGGRERTVMIQEAYEEDKTIEAVRKRTGRRTQPSSALAA